MTCLRINHFIMALRIHLVFLTVQGVKANLFQPVSSPCIYWESLSLYSYSETKKLHCILDENNQPGIVTATWKWVEPGHCPYFDRHSNVISVKPCDRELGKCPEREIYSFQAVKYSACCSTQNRNETSLTKTNTNVPVTTSSAPITSCGKEFIFTFLVILLALITIQLVILGLQLYLRLLQSRRLKRGKYQGCIKKSEIEGLSSSGSTLQTIDYRSFEIFTWHFDNRIAIRTKTCARHPVPDAHTCIAIGNSYTLCLRGKFLEGGVFNLKDNKQMGITIEKTNIFVEAAKQFKQ